MVLGGGRSFLLLVTTVNEVVMEWQGIVRVPSKSSFQI